MKPKPLGKYRGELTGLGCMSQHTPSQESQTVDQSDKCSKCKFCGVAYKFESISNYSDSEIKDRE